MKSARHQFILLGLICQGLLWDDWAMPLLNSLLWVACLTWPRRTRPLGQAADMAAYGKRDAAMQQATQRDLSDPYLWWPSFGEIIW